VKDGNQVAIVHGGGPQLHAHPEAARASRANLSRACASPMRKRADTALMVLGGGVKQALLRPLAHMASPPSDFPAATVSSSARAKSAPPPTSDLSAKSLPPIRAGSKPSGRWAQSPSSPRSPSASTANTTTSTPTDGRGLRRRLQGRRARLLTDVPGVLGADGSVMRWLSIDQIAELTRDEVITGGMLPKLSACREALLNGVKRVRILPAAVAASLPDLCSSRISTARR